MKTKAGYASRYFVPAGDLPGLTPRTPWRSLRLRPESP